MQLIIPLIVVLVLSCLIAWWLVPSCQDTYSRSGVEVSKAYAFSGNLIGILVILGGAFFVFGVIKGLETI